MKWQDPNDKSWAEACRAVADRSNNNNLKDAGLLKHHAEEPLVLRHTAQPARSRTACRGCRSFRTGNSSRPQISGSRPERPTAPEFQDFKVSISSSNQGPFATRKQ